MSLGNLPGVQLILAGVLHRRPAFVEVHKTAMVSYVPRLAIEMVLFICLHITDGQIPPQEMRAA
jgi:hypothetical protein